MGFDLENRSNGAVCFEPTARFPRFPSIPDEPQQECRRIYGLYEKYTVLPKRKKQRREHLQKLREAKQKLKRQLRPVAKGQLLQSCRMERRSYKERLERFKLEKKRSRNQYRHSLCEITRITAPDFKKFGSLPVKVRFRIWEFTISPRVIPMPRRDFSGLECGYRFAKFDVPQVLHICQETRTEFLKRYKAVSLSNRGQDSRVCHVNFEIDTVFPYGNLMVGRDWLEDMGDSCEEITQIALTKDDMISRDFVSSLKKLRRIDIVCGDPRRALESDYRFFRRPRDDGQPPQVDWHTYRKSASPFWVDKCKTEDIPWEHLVQSKAKSLMVELWPHPVSIDFVELHAPNFAYPTGHEISVPHFRLGNWNDHWMEGRDGFGVQCVTLL